MNKPLTVLFVDDDPYVRKVLCASLERAGFVVLSAVDGPGALEAARKFTATIHILVSDVMMPGMSGPELAAELSRARPGLKILLISAFPQFPIANDDSWEFLHKPFSPSVLVSKILEMCPAEAPPFPSERAPAGRHQEEEMLRNRMREARVEYVRYCKEYDRLLAISHDIAGINSDGALALHQAAELRRSTLRAYSAVVRQFADFVKHQRGRAGA